MSNWSKMQTLELIVLYEQNPILYNCKSEEFLDRLKKNDVLVGITTSLKAVRPEVTLDEVKIKIKTLRNQYFRERNAHAKSKKSGSGADQVNFPKLWCFNELKFLDKFVVSTPSISNIEQLNDVSPLDAVDNSTLAEDAVPKTSGKKSKSFDMQITRSLNVVEEMAQRMRDKAEKGTSPQYHLGKMVENELKGIPQQLFFEAKWRIMDILQEVQKKYFQSKATAQEHHFPPEYQPPSKFCKLSNINCEMQPTSSYFDSSPSPSAGCGALQSCQPSSSVLMRSAGTEAVPKTFSVKYGKPQIIKLSTIKEPHID